MSVDRHNMLGILSNVVEHIKGALHLAQNIRITSPINKIVVAGMGGSGSAGHLLKAVLKDNKVPVYVCQGYKLPKFIDEHSLVFVVSYSGNNEETILMYSDALKKNAKVIIITSGGKLRYIEKDLSIKTILVPTGFPPRLATPYLFFPIYTILHNSRMLQPKLLDLEGLYQSLSNPAWMEKGAELAEKLFNKVPLIYTSPGLEPVGYRWKMLINENAKVHAFNNTFSELTHNEVEGFANNNGNFHVLMIRDDQDINAVKKRMNITKKVLKEQGVDVTEISVRGHHIVNKLFTAMHFGALTSYYLAQKYNTDPTPTKVIEQIKKEVKG